MAATIKIPTTFTAEDKYSKVIKKMTGSVKKFGKTGVAAVKRFDSKVTKSFKKLGRLGQLALGLSIGTIFTMAIANNIAYEDSLASVSAITGAVGEDLAKLEALSMNTAKASKMLGADVLKAYELVGSAKPELLENAEALDNVTKSVITLSKASRMDLAESAKSLTDVMNQFNIAGADSGKVIDVLAAGAKFGAAAIPDLSASIVQFGTVAKQSNVNLYESVAAVELFASKGIKGAEAGTKMRNVLTTLATAKALPAKAQEELAKFGVNLDIVTDSALPLSVRLKEMSKIGGDATAMVKVFGKENQGAGAILLNNIDALDDLTAKVKEQGVAVTQATTNSNTFQFALDSIKTSFLNATTATQSNNGALEWFKETLFSVGDNIESIIVAAASLVGAFILMKAIVLGTAIVTGAYNIALGINTAITQTNKKAIIGNTLATNAYKVAMAIGTGVTWLATAATTAFGIALNLGLWPILLIIAAIVAVVLVIKNWSAITDWFGEKWKAFTGFLSEAWNNVVKWFKDFDFKAMFMGIGQSIIKFMLTPLTFMLKLLSKLPGGIGDAAQLGLDKIEGFTGSFAVTPEDEALPSTTQASNSSVIETTRNTKLAIDIKDKGGNVEKVSQSNRDGDIPINTTNTIGAF
jgi:TP901 family phage tail tape measure protein